MDTTILAIYSGFTTAALAIIAWIHRRKLDQLESTVREVEASDNAIWGHLSRSNKELREVGHKRLRAEKARNRAVRRRLHDYEARVKRLENYTKIYEEKPF